MSSTISLWLSIIQLHIEVMVPHCIIPQQTRFFLIKNKKKSVFKMLITIYNLSDSVKQARCQMPKVTWSYMDQGRDWAALGASHPGYNLPLGSWSMCLDMTMHIRFDSLFINKDAENKRCRTAVYLSRASFSLVCCSLLVIPVYPLNYNDVKLGSVEPILKQIQ